jgi:lipopolysaccharide/colanic/teichoic acid biosynthesis glycosyltransferase
VGIQEQFADGAETLTTLPAPFHVAFRLPQTQVSALWVRSFFKRLLDLAIAVPALLLAAPVLAVLIVLIRLDSEGPAFFRQKRLGLDGRAFSILKLRTMTVREDGVSVVQAVRNDVRITRIGRFLRASSLDEVPQLINVIKGDMSLVGPRPHAWSHDMLYTQLIDNYTLRQDAKPGITGWAQVHGLRGGTPTLDLMRRRVDFDVWYAKNASILLDLKIILRTPVELLRGRNAF